MDPRSSLSNIMVSGSFLQRNREHFSSSKQVSIFFPQKHSFLTFYKFLLEFSFSLPSILSENNFLTFAPEICLPLKVYFPGPVLTRIKVIHSLINLSNLMATHLIAIALGSVQRIKTKSSKNKNNLNTQDSVSLRSKNNSSSQAVKQQPTRSTSKTCLTFQPRCLQEQPDL